MTIATAIAVATTAIAIQGDRPSGLRERGVQRRCLAAVDRHGRPSRWPDARRRASGKVAVGTRTRMARTPRATIGVPFGSRPAGALVVASAATTSLHWRRQRSDPCAAAVAIIWASTTTSCRTTPARSASPCSTEKSGLGARWPPTHLPAARRLFCRRVCRTSDNLGRGLAVRTYPIRSAADPPDVDRMAPC